METETAEAVTSWEVFERCLQVAGFAIFLYEVWTVLVPQGWKIELKARMATLRGHAPGPHPHARNAVIYNLLEITDACEHEIGAEVDKLTYDRRRNDPS